MTWIALKMLMGDRSKYFAIVFGVSFACFLIAEQSAIFCGVMLRTVSPIRDTHGIDIWVMNSNVRYVDDLKPISDDDLYRVRSVPGVDWAVSLYRGQGQVQLASGVYQGVILMGLDDASLTGAPVHMLMGRIGDLQIPDSILVDEAGFHQMWPGEPVRTGKVIEMNQRRAVVVGVYRAAQTFMTMPIIYTRFSQATLFVPPTPTGRLTPFVLAKARPGTDPEDLARRIQARTGLKALTNEGFANLTMGYYLGHTGIPLNFGTTVVLAFLVGTAIAGQTFYLFTVENLKQFGTLKAMGMSDRRVVVMILTQGLVVGGIGYGIGVGLATVYGIFAQRALPLLAFFLPWQVLALTAAAMIVIVLLASLVSIRRALVLEPAVVFQGGA
ncbi:ABC transporter permease [Frigoriglobus tundricola]|uniref:ABC-type antimicrobial peptide transport system, permease component n=1 Tax=Frigoriglobus tundricola TaxID=2774151 RepID=A0A6M5YNN3_9BACT|nr:ABC transporter permease [Frigoriglobus tundricola]QJW94572.1 ABC-type antimicrobial peptide transport system, permease component [Frigoriglobus tundricola]